MNNRYYIAAPPAVPILYRVVYGSKFVVLATLVLVSAFLLQPVHRAFAAEEVAPEVEPLLLDGILDDVLEETPEVLDVVVPQEVSPSDSAVVVTEVPEIEIVSEDTTTQDDPASTQEDSAATVIDEVDVLASSSTAPVEEGLVTDVYAVSLASTTIASSSVVDAEATSSDATPAVFTVESDTHVSFNKDDCTIVSDGSYYCKTAEEISPQDRPDGFYSLPDSDGDLEIYLQQEAELRQLTHNTVDDASPYFDENSNTLVWQRSVQDRFQIFSLDLTTGVESQLTSGSVNNMEPHQNGSYTVWQHWNGNWDIVLAVGGDIKNISDNLAQDISPSIRNGLVIWQRTTDEGERTLELYTIKTGERTTIKDTDGGAISNPRMVVVYESMQSNGDVVTKGYDLITGEIISLDETAPVLPDTIPDPDDIGETRALIQGKTNSREDSVEFSDDIISDTSAATSTPIVIAEGDLVVAGSSPAAQISTSTPLVVASSTVADLTLDLRPVQETDQGSEYTLVVPVLTQTASSAEVFAVPEI